ncbi:GxxExxY protein [Akkermansia glycaniphila]|uniref:Gxxexxy: gxxexxy protein n=1 Tax=Akkermansia glycaniphila TaxID=1679444 RepID=A0A1C7PEP8_9BACT|nr:GxxExxY protein [Akkermansia glycaniphila]OCA04047.1 NADH:ubiquinone oxidoreductase [Akkermansia glycaniphila]SEH72880.1 gxxexxy: gxxexxy protein [Akkermansia glycaniphila]
MYTRDSDPLTYDVIGAAMAVHRELGCGFLESTYQEALEWELHTQGIPYEREAKLNIHYKGHLLPSSYRADFVCHGTLLLELKALTHLSGTEDAQILNYLKITKLTKALLFNFGTPQLYYKRYIMPPSADI